MSHKGLLRPLLVTDFRDPVAPVLYSVIVFTAVIDWLVWHHHPTWAVYAGIALVIGGGLIAVRARSA